MILQQLRKDSDRILPEMPPPMYNYRQVRWVISLGIDGTLEGFIKTEGEGKKGSKGQQFLVPDVKVAGSVIRPKLMADTPAYTLGMTDDYRAALKFAETKRIVEECATQTGYPEVHAVHRFLETWSPESGYAPDEMTEADLITFRVGEIFPIDLPEVRKFWEDNARKSKGGGKSANQCLICGGTEAEIVDRQPTKIKGILGGQPGGTDLVSINSTAFESYGLKAAFSSPTCRDCGERYAKSLNALLAGARTHLYIGPAAFVFWTADEAFDPLAFLDNPVPERVRDLLSSFLTGKKMAEIHKTDFYATSLTANSARAVVRDWLHTTVGEAEDKLAEWIARLLMTDSWGKEGLPLGIKRLAASLYRDANKEMVALVPRLLTRAALYGDPLPDYLMAQAIKRNRAEASQRGNEKAVTYIRAALIKAVLTSNVHDPKELERMSKLDPNHKEPAYHCGRLLAVLEALQQQAIRGINTTLVDRFYGSASTSPASVFGTLVKGAQPHLSVLRRTNEGAFHSIQRRLEEINDAIGGQYPPTLTLRQQGFFSLGYYQQRAHDRASMLAASEAKKQRNAQSDDTSSDAIDPTDQEDTQNA